jgi:hypothetical protein
MFPSHETSSIEGYYYFGHYGIDGNRRDMFLSHPFYNWTVEWCEKYDQASFDPDYPSLDVSQFLPIVERVLARPQYVSTKSTYLSFNFLGIIG